MGVVVQKYGGSSVADVDKLARVAARVVATKRAGYEVVVVVSAMGKTTDDLLALARSVASASAPTGVAGSAAGASRRELDMLVSTGERISMALLSIAIQSLGEDAISFTGSQSGILTNDRHFDARIVEVRPYRIEDELHRGRIVIVAGFQGMSYRREITTLGRGGSDTTAVALAAALRAERCEIYSDVDGVYSADPRVVADAHHLPEVSIDALQELAEGGAKVLCAQAVEWARERGIVIHARRTTDGWYADGGDAGAEPARPQRSNPLQTVVVRDATDACRGVTAHRAAAVCTLPAVQAPALLGWAYEAGMTVFEADIPNAGEALVLLPTATWPDRERMLQALVERFADVRLSSVDVVSIVTQGTEGAPFVGEWLRRAQAVATVHRTLARPMRVSLVVDAGQADAVVRVVHEARQQG